MTHILLYVTLIPDEKAGRLMSNDSFSQFLESSMAQKRFSNRTLAERARVSFRIIADVRSGRLEKDLQVKGKLSKRKIGGVSSSTYRLLIALGEEPETWMKKLGLVIPQAEVAQAQGFGSRIQLILEKPLTAEEIGKFGRVQKELGEWFTVEMALRLLIRKHNV
ncbi:MAG: hypothetical protein ABL917_01220 [Parcubacteria group bacterium]